ncbi:growth-regulating factor 1-like [Musa acuminata AAA Group]|uniref:growth-regulating factor 1-like n=1 Tax=Musa acuminata AAA Group TaxID=214697 RepID=UPI0031D06915
MHPPLQPQYERLGLREPSLEASVRFPVIMSGISSSYPFTPSQWQELEQQRLFYRYMVSGIPNPWDLSLRIRRSFLLEPTTMISPTVAYPPHLHLCWGRVRLGVGREGEDTEPGRCRRTDGKKWRCSKEAFPGSKYCEKHMHRGKNRSRKPVEMSLANNLSTTAQPPSSFSSTTTKSSTSNTPCHHHPYHLPVPAPEVFSFLTCPSSKSQHNTPTYNSADNAYRYQHGMKSVDEHFSEAAGGERKNSSRFRPLGMNSLVGKGHMAFVPQQSTSSHSRIDLPREEKPQHCFVLGTDLKLEKPATVEAKQKPLLHFLDERPTTSNTLCLDSKADHSKTQLSISIPVAYHDFPAFKSGFNREWT